MIKQIKVNGFRNLKNVVLDMKEFTALVANAGCGKTNLIDAIQCGLRLIQYDPISLLQFNNASILEINKNEDFSFEITLSTTDDKTDVVYGYSIAWGNEIRCSHVLTEYLYTNNNGVTKTYLSRTGEDAKYDDGLPELTKIENVEKSELVLKNLIGQTSSREVRDIIDLLTADTSICRVTPTWTDNGKYAIEMACELKEDYIGQFRLLEDLMKDLFTDIESINVPAYSEIKGKNGHLVKCPLTVKFINSGEIEFTKASKSLQETFLALLNIAWADINRCDLILIDNIEGSIHPKLFQTYLRMINNLAGNCQVIFSTQSPVLLQYINPENIKIGFKSEHGEVEFRAVTDPDNLIKDAVNMDQSTGDLIFENLCFDNAEELMEKYLSASQFKHNKD